ncbi:uncharacterized protein [Nicotiana tomentosiformis]|uniref:uncharacterized protein n=1 Tax=Nicotiana tomentosiformis TaxID=4098 RepID=UPI00388C4F3D
METSGVSFTTFQLTGASFIWWETYERSRPVGAAPFSWHKFFVLLLEKFVPPTRREELRRQFEQLRQEGMYVTKYEMRFSELARQTVWLVPTERERIRRFIDVLTYQLHFVMTRESVSGARFDEVVDIARWLEFVRSQECKEREAKRPHGSGGFSSVYSGEGRVIAYASRQLNPHEKNYPVHNLEERQYDDPHLLVIKDTVQHDDAKDVTIKDDGVLRIQGWICVPNVDGLHELIREEANSSWYSIYSGAAKMYQDLRQHYWWRRMKKDIVGFVAWFLNYDQVKYEHQRTAGFLQRLESPEWKWLDEIYIRDTIRLHSVPVSIISDRAIQFTL